MKNIIFSPEDHASSRDSVTEMLMSTSMKVQKNQIVREGRCLKYRFLVPSPEILFHLVPRNLHFQSSLPRAIWTDQVYGADFAKHWPSILFDVKIQGEMHGQVLRRVGVGTAGKFHLFPAVQVFFYCFQLWVEINYPLFPNTSVLKSFHQRLKSPMPPASS